MKREAKHEDSDDFKGDTEKPPCKQRHIVKEKHRRGEAWCGAMVHGKTQTRELEVLSTSRKRHRRKLGRQLADNSE